MKKMALVVKFLPKNLLRVEKLLPLHCQTITINNNETLQSKGSNQDA